MHEDHTLIQRRDEKSQPPHLDGQGVDVDAANLPELDPDTSQRQLIEKNRARIEEAIRVALEKARNNFKEQNKLEIEKAINVALTIERATMNAEIDAVHADRNLDLETTQNQIQEIKDRYTDKAEQKVADQVISQFQATYNQRLSQVEQTAREEAIATVVQQIANEKAGNSTVDSSAINV